MPRAIITSLGEALLGQAAGSETAVQIASMALGDGGGAPVEPDAGQTALVGERLRIDVEEQRYLGGGRWRVIAEVAADAAPFDLREIGFLSSGGDLVSLWAGADVSARQIGVVTYRIMYLLDLGSVEGGAVIIAAADDELWRHVLADAAATAAMTSQVIEMRRSIGDLYRRISAGGPNWITSRAARSERRAAAEADRAGAQADRAEAARAVVEASTEVPPALARSILRDARRLMGGRDLDLLLDAELGYQGDPRPGTLALACGRDGPAYRTTEGGVLVSEPADTLRLTGRGQDRAWLIEDAAAQYLAAPADLLDPTWLSSDSFAIAPGVEGHHCRNKAENGGRAISTVVGAIPDGPCTFWADVERDDAAQTRLSLRNEDTATFLYHATYTWGIGDFAVSGAAQDTQAHAVPLGVGPNGGEMIRLVVTVTLTEGSSSHRAYIYPTGPSQNGEAVWFHRANLTNTASVTSYIDGAHTRAADTVTFDADSWWPGSAGTIIKRFRSFGAGTLLGGGGDRRLFYASGADLAASDGANVATVSAPSGDAWNDAWHTAVLTWGDGQMRIGIDGVMGAAVPHAGNWSTAETLAIGSRPDGSESLTSTHSRHLSATRDPLSEAEAIAAMGALA